jgi:hypothetical protein
MNKMNGSALRWFARVGSVAAALALAACGGGGGGGGDVVVAGGSGGSPGGGGSTGGSVATGTLQMSMTDAPACYQSVVVNVAKVRVHMSDDGNTGDNDNGWQEIVPPNAPVRIDLLNLTNGQINPLGSATVPAGKFRQIRLVLAATGNTVTPVGGTPQALKTPSGQQSGLKIKADFDVLANTVNDILLDVDACKSIVQTGNGNFLLKPVVRVSTKPSGTIQGFVTTTVALGTTTATLNSIAVSAQQNGTVIRSTIPDTSGRFILSYLPLGTYTVVITGDGVHSGGVLDTTKGAATRVVDNVPVGATTVNLNTSTSTFVLSSSAMSTVTGTVTAITPVAAAAISDDVLVSAMQTVKSRLVQVNSVRVDDDTGKYALHLPVGAPELQLFSLQPVPQPLLASITDPAAAGVYTIRSSGENLATKEAPANITGGPAIVNFSY